MPIFNDKTSAKETAHHLLIAIGVAVNNADGDMLKAWSFLCAEIGATAGALGVGNDESPAPKGGHVVGIA